jgi:hypothetical protein
VSITPVLSTRTAGPTPGVTWVATVAAPTDLHITECCDGKIGLEFTDKALNEQGFLMERCDGGVDAAGNCPTGWKTIANIPPRLGLTELPQVHFVDYQVTFPPTETFTPSPPPTISVAVRVEPGIDRGLSDWVMVVLILLAGIAGAYWYNFKMRRK